MKPPAPRPCISCPYKKDTPSGVWTEGEYEKLPEYDKVTSEQPPGVFLCHQQDGRVCAGWAGCHNQNPPGHELLALRLAVAFRHMTYEVAEQTCNYKSPVPLWSNGKEAWLYGTLDIEEPGIEAQDLIRKMERRLKEAWDAEDPDTSGDAEEVPD